LKTLLAAVIANSFMSDDGEETLSLSTLSAKKEALIKADDKAFEELQTEAFLPRVQLMTSNSQKCKDGAFTVNNYALIRGQEYIDIGQNVDVLVCAWRPMALEIGDSVISSYDPSTQTFANIKGRSDTPDSGCMWGFQFLLWIPQVAAFATFFMGSKSARRAAPDVKAQMNGPATLTARKIKKGKYTWFAPTCHECTTPFDMPSKGGYEQEMEKFNNPTAPEVELAAETSRPQ